MNVFHWDRNFETGLAEVDQQHHRLVDITNAFGTLVSRHEVHPEDIESIYAELVAYTQYHFDEEEKLMTQLGVDARHTEQHSQEHLRFLQEVTQMHTELVSDEIISSQTLFEFLMSWLVYHILGQDMSMSRQVLAIRSGTIAAEAYLAEERKVDKATSSLLKSLNNIFQQVSQRNRQLNELNLTLENKVAERTTDLTRANQKLEELASTDVLTGLPNRRHAMQRLAQLWDEALRDRTPLTCMMLDADGFKRINDSFGHEAGDVVLQTLARALQHAIRSDDIVCRLGGDEFLVLCPDTAKEGALQMASQVHARVAELSVPVNGGAWQGSISLGVAVSNPAIRSPEELIKAADKGVYAAKAAGKNCVRMVV